MSENTTMDSIETNHGLLEPKVELESDSVKLRLEEQTRLTYFSTSLPTIDHHSTGDRRSPCCLEVYQNEGTTPKYEYTGGFIDSNFNAEPTAMEYRDTDCDLSKKPAYCTFYPNQDVECKYKFANSVAGNQMCSSTGKLNEDGLIKQGSFPPGKHPLVENDNRCMGSYPNYDSAQSGKKQYQCDAPVHHQYFPQASILPNCDQRPVTRASYQCDVCQKYFSTKGHLTEHKRIHTGERRYQCNICQKRFIAAGHLSVHKRTHTGEKPYQCDVCQRRFIYSNDLRRHKQIHTGEKPFKCDICGKAFIRNTYLVIHRRVHTGEKPYHCDICGGSFSTQYYLTSHKKIHTNGKNFKCDICGKAFSTRGYLVTHQRVHAGQKQKTFPCYICGGEFASQTYLVTHQRVHAREKTSQSDGKQPFQCDVCQKSFARADSLIEHHRMHTENGLFQCDVCLLLFHRVDHLNMHKRMHTDLQSMEYDHSKVKTEPGSEEKIKEEQNVHPECSSSSLSDKSSAAPQVAESTLAKLKVEPFFPEKKQRSQITSDSKSVLVQIRTVPHTSAGNSLPDGDTYEHLPLPGQDKCAKLQWLDKGLSVEDKYSRSGIIHIVPEVQFDKSNELRH